MANINVNLVRPSKAPSLPVAPAVYNQQAEDKYSNILRLYFNTIDNITSAILGVIGMTSFSAPYGSFIDTSTVVAVPNVAATVLLDGTNLNSSQVYIGTPTSRIYITNAGVYNYQYSLQIANIANAIYPVTVWIRQNGVDVPDSSSVFTTVDRGSGGVHAEVILAINYLIPVQAGDYIELVWLTTSTNVSLSTVPARVTAPIYPRAPAVIITVTFVSALPA
jgi:hypothetical protein